MDDGCIHTCTFIKDKEKINKIVHKLTNMSKKRL